MKARSTINVLVAVVLFAGCATSGTSDPAAARSKAQSFADGCVTWLLDQAVKNLINWGVSGALK